ncbi:hypothetical protein [Lacticaseibacillus saniviri]|uniref:hypothetical protein n=1 Tax=Lacticaseibacillus saniviri TaxID=931533 RepID=UPI000A5016D5|nr:hypothetical protein [Lacticaseibacillus saniviri]
MPPVYGSVSKNDEKADKAKIEALDGVVTVNITPTQYQVIIGNEVAHVFDAIIAEGVTNGDVDDSATETSTPKKNKVSSARSSMPSPPA